MHPRFALLVAVALLAGSPALALAPHVPSPDAVVPAPAPAPVQTVLLETPAGRVEVPVPADAEVLRTPEGGLRLVSTTPVPAALDPALLDLALVTRADVMREDGAVRVVVRGTLPDALPAGVALAPAPPLAGLHLVHARLDALAALAALDGVTRVEPALDLQPVLDDSVPLVRAPDAWNRTDARGRPLTGHGVTIAIIDTGVDYTHPDLGGCLGAGCKVAGGWDHANDDADPMDDHGHGTHVAATAAGARGVAPDATLLAFKVCSATGGCPGHAIVAAVRDAVARGADVISMSLGSSVPGDGTDYISVELDAARDAGVVVVVAAGNAGPRDGSVGIPAVARGAIAVGATDKADAPADFGSRGPTLDLRLKPDLAAPGVGIVAAVPAGACNLCEAEGRRALSGTSMSAPHVGGAAALLVQAHPSWDPERVRSALLAGARDVGAPAAVQGHGRLDVAAALDAPVLFEPARVDFGALAGVGSATATVTLTNVRDARANVTLALSGDLPAGVALAVEPRRLDLPPGGTGSVRVTLRFLDDEPVRFDAVRVRATTEDGATVDLPVAFARPFRVEVTAPGHGLHWACLLQVDGAEGGCRTVPRSTSFAFHVYERGSYTVITRPYAVDPPWDYTLVVHEGVPVPGPDVALDVPGMRVPLAFQHRTVDDEPADPATSHLVLELNYVASAERAFSLWTHGRLPSVFLTPASERATLLARVQFLAANGELHDWNDAATGFGANGVTLAADPARYRTEHLDMPAMPGHWFARACSWWHPAWWLWMGACPYSPPAVAAAEGGRHVMHVQPVDAFLQPLPHHDPHHQFSTDTQLHWENAWPAPTAASTRSAHGPDFLVLENGTRRADWYRDVGPARAVWGLGAGALSWTGWMTPWAIYNADRHVKGFAWFTAADGSIPGGGDARPACGFPDVRYRFETPDGARIEDGVWGRDADGGCVHEDFVQLGDHVPADQGFTLHLASDWYSRLGTDVHARLTRPQSHGGDREPPFVREARLENATGVATAHVRDARDARLVVHATDRDSGLALATAEVRPAGRDGTEWSNLTVSTHGAVVTVAFPALADGAYAVRVRLEDAAGNLAEWTTDPALFVNVTLPRTADVTHPGGVLTRLACEGPRPECAAAAEAWGSRVDVRGLSAHAYRLEWDANDAHPLALLGTSVRVCWLDGAGGLLGACTDAPPAPDADAPLPLVPAGAADAVIVAEGAPVRATLTVLRDVGVLATP